MAACTRCADRIRRSAVSVCSLTSYDRMAPFPGTWLPRAAPTSPLLPERRIRVGLFYGRGRRGQDPLVQGVWTHGRVLEPRIADCFIAPPGIGRGRQSPCWSGCQQPRQFTPVWSPSVDLPVGGSADSQLTPRARVVGVRECPLSASTTLGAHSATNSSGAGRRSGLGNSPPSGRWSSLPSDRRGGRKSNVGPGLSSPKQ